MTKAAELHISAGEMARLELLQITFYPNSDLNAEVTFEILKVM